MVPEAPLEETEAGLVAAGAGWFVLNARKARWIRRDRRGHSLPFTGFGDVEETYFPQLGVNLIVLEPGEALLLVEGEERPLRQWDFVHCPPETKHMLVGAGEGCTVLAVGAREHQAGGDWGGYTVDEVALRHGVGVEEETNDVAVAYARFANSEPTRYRDGLLPS